MDLPGTDVIGKMKIEFPGSMPGNFFGDFLEFDTTGKIGQITGAGFNSNDVTISGADITGGLIYNRGELVGLSNTNVKGNTATSDTGNVYGGVISNAGTISGDIKGVTFEGNNATSTSGNVNGGVLHNTGIFNGKIVNSTFKNNTATSTKGTAHGGAIYSTTDVSIAGDNGTTLIQGNKVVDSSGTRNEAIYIDSRIAKLTLDAKNSGKVLIYDDIDGYEGYSLILQGYNSGKIGLYGNINNANVTVNGGNIDFVNGVTSDLNFGQFTSSESAKYSIDLDVAKGKADTFIVGTGSTGKIVIDNINAIGDSYDSKLIQIRSSVIEVYVFTFPEIIHRRHFGQLHFAFTYLSRNLLRLSSNIYSEFCGFLFYKAVEITLCRTNRNLHIIL